MLRVVRGRYNGKHDINVVVQILMYKCIPLCRYSCMLSACLLRCHFTFTVVFSDGGSDLFSPQKRLDQRVVQIWMVSDGLHYQSSLYSAKLKCKKYMI